MISQKDLKRAIFDRKEKLSMEEIFLSEAYNTFLTQMAQGITQKKNNCKAVMYNKNDNSAAYTDGETTYINYSSEAALSMNQVERHTYYCGLNLHECGHLKFTDFKLSKKNIEEMLNKKLYPTPPQNDYLEELEKFLEQDGNAQILASLFKELDNCIEDGFVDRAVTAIAPGYASCLRFEKKADSTIGKQTYKEMVDQKMPKTVIFINLVLTYAVYGELLYEETEHDELLDSFREMIPVIRDAVFEPSPFIRKKKGMLVLCYLFHFFEQQSNQQKSGGNGQQDSNQNQSGSGLSGNSTQSNSQGSESQQSSSGSSQSSSESGDQSQSGQGQSQNGTQSGSSETTSSQGKSEQDENALKNMLQEAINAMPKGKETSRKNVSGPDEEAIKQLTEALKNTEEKNSSSAPQNNPSATESDELNKIAEKVAESQIQNEQEQDIANQMQCDVKQFLDGVVCHKNVGCVTQRIQQTVTGKKRYEDEHHELDLIVKRFLKEFLKEIQDRQLGDTQTGLYAGKRFNARAAYRYDKRVMSNKIAPEDIPDMAVGILIDSSGSMYGEKISYARKCAYITYSFCQALAIPCFVIGHTTQGSSVKLMNVVDEASLDGKDAQRIFELTNDDCNRDGYALRYCLGRLRKIVADQKIMLIISDGRPNHNGYGYQTGKEDIQDAVRKGVKDGISTIAAAIDDAETIKTLYQDGISPKYAAEYLDLSDLQKLPKAFVKILKSMLE